MNLPFVKPGAIVSIRTNYGCTYHVKIDKLMKKTESVYGPGILGKYRLKKAEPGDRPFGGIFNQGTFPFREMVGINLLNRAKL